MTTVQSETCDLRKIDIKAFCDDLRKTDLDAFPPEAEQNVNAMWTSWTEKFFSVLNKHAPLTKRSLGTITHVHRLCPWSTPQLKQLQHRRLADHRQLKKNPGDVHLREHFCHLRKEASRLSRRLKNDFFRRQCAEHLKNPKKLSQHINKVTGRLKHHHLPKCEPAELTIYFASIAEDPNRPDDHSKNRQKTANSSDTGNRAPCLDQFSPVTSETVEKHLRSIDPSKASRSDCISGLLPKRCAAVLAPSLTKILTTSIVTGTVPHLFKKATVTPIHKSGDKSQAGNYCNRNPETRQKLCGAHRWYRAAVVQRLWRRRPISETRVRSSVATHLLTSLNLPVSSLAPDSNRIPITLVAEDGLEARAGCRALGRRIV